MAKKKDESLKSLDKKLEKIEQILNQVVEDQIQVSVNEALQIWKEAMQMLVRNLPGHHRMRC